MPISRSISDTFTPTSGAAVSATLLTRQTAPTDLKVAVAIASGRLTKQAWNEMGSAGREKLFRPHGFTAWEDRS